jgi:hypothetical protein
MEQIKRKLVFVPRHNAPAAPSVAAEHSTLQQAVIESSAEQRLAPALWFRTKSQFQELNFCSAFPQRRQSDAQSSRRNPHTQVEAHRGTQCRSRLEGLL